MIYVRLIGGLGNQMFQYALGRHLALKNRTELIVDTTYFDFVPKNTEYFTKRKYDLELFHINVLTLDQKNASWLPYYSIKRRHRLKHLLKRLLNLYKHVGGHRIIYEKKLFSFDESILDSGDNLYLVGYWQNERYFKDIEQEIRRDFTIRNRFSNDVSKLASEISNTKSLCLNVRRGDFVKSPTHGFVGTEYISRAVNHMRDAVDIRKVFIFSDDIDWCKNNLRFDIPSLFVNDEYTGGDFAADLYLMTKCSHFIISNSTFGWWGAWLAENSEKTVIAPEQWVNVPGLDASGIIPDGWTTL